MSSERSGFLTTVRRGEDNIGMVFILSAFVIVLSLIIILEEDK